MTKKLRASKETLVERMLSRYPFDFAEVLKKVDKYLKENKPRRKGGK